MFTIHLKNILHYQKMMGHRQLPNDIAITLVLQLYQKLVKLHVLKFTLH